VTERVANAFVWPVPFTLEMQSCGFPNARWDLATRKLTLCYELAAEFADLYRNYGGARADSLGVEDSKKRKKSGAASFKASHLPTRHKRKSGR
jgi:hypothetical protein